jgi:hypothetical protein
MVPEGVVITASRSYTGAETDLPTSTMWLSSINTIMHRSDERQIEWQFLNTNNNHCTQLRIKHMSIRAATLFIWRELTYKGGIILAGLITTRH